MYCVNRNTSVGIASRYGLDRHGMVSVCVCVCVGGGEISRTPPDGSWGPPSLLYNVQRVFLKG